MATQGLRPSPGTQSLIQPLWACFLGAGTGPRCSWPSTVHSPSKGWFGPESEEQGGPASWIPDPVRVWSGSPGTNHQPLQPCWLPRHQSVCLAGTDELGDAEKWVHLPGWDPLGKQGKVGGVSGPMPGWARPVTHPGAQEPWQPPARPPSRPGIPGSPADGNLLVVCAPERISLTFLLSP